MAHHRGNGGPGPHPNSPPTSPHPTIQRHQDPPTPWAKSTAKKLLHDDIVTERTKQFRGPTGIYNSRPEYQKYRLSNFSSNYYSLRKAIQGRIQVKKKAEAAFQHDKLLIKDRRANKFYYPGSLVEKQLRSDVQRGYTNGKTPSEVFGSRRIFRNSHHLSLTRFSNFLSFERHRHHRLLHEKDYQERMRFINARIDTSDNNEEEDEED